jgi:hypothetical protein
MIATLILLASVAAAEQSPCSYVTTPNPHSLADAASFLATTLSTTSGTLDEDVIICVSGVHNAPLSLGAEHAVRSGRGRIIWRGEPGAAISGGAQVTLWTPTTLGGGNVFVAPVPPTVVAAGIVVRQLWVSGARAARTLVTDVSNVLKGMTMWTGDETSGFIAGSVPPAWLVNNTQSIEFTWPIVLHNWISPRCTIASMVPLNPSPSPNNMSGPLPGVSVVSQSGINPRGNVTGHVEYAGDFPSAGACAAACVAATRCTSYTYHDSTVGDGFALGCYFRVDGEWDPEAGWRGHFSGNKGGSAGGVNITLASPCGGFLLSQGRAVPVTAEAAPVFPLPAGTFYHDKTGGLLYYALGANQTAADLADDAWVSAQEVLLNVDHVSGHLYESLAFIYGSWGQVNTGDGFVDAQAAVFSCTPGGATPYCGTGLVASHPGTVQRAGGPPMASAEPRGNVRVSGGADVVFTGCTFAHLGAAYALSVMEGSQRPMVINCSFTDLSGGFLKLGSVTMTAANSSDHADWDAGAVVAYNTADDMAIEYDGAAGYFGGFLYSALITQNSVSDAGYSGFSQGWGWGTVFPIGVGNNTISGNKIVNVMRLLRDGGGIYVNGAENQAWPQSTISGNFVDQDQAVFAGASATTARVRAFHMPPR